jgi:Fe-S-cluster containining protein
VKPSEEFEQKLAFVLHQEGDAVLSFLAESKTSETLHKVVDHTYSFDAQAKRALVAQLVKDPRRLPVCTPGCAFCCHLSVMASVPEILRIAKHLRDTLDADRLAELLAANAITAKRIAPMSPDERAHAKVACPLLDVATGRCGVYDVRPLACRGYNSCDAGACERAFEACEPTPRIPVELTQFAITRNVGSGLCVGAAAAGLDPGPYELSAGLAVAFAVPDAEARWLRGEAVFAAAETSGAGAMRDAWRRGFAEQAKELVGAARWGGAITTPKDDEEAARRRERNRRKREKRR